MEMKKHSLYFGKFIRKTLDVLDGLSDGPKTLCLLLIICMTYDLETFPVFIYVIIYLHTLRHNQQKTLSST